MMLSAELIPAVRALVADLAAGHYEELERDGRAGRLSAADLRQVISTYGKTLIPPPEEAFEAWDAYPLVDSSRWALDIDLWTAEDGHSDLTLTATARMEHGRIVLEVDDLHVL